MTDPTPKPPPPTLADAARMADDLVHVVTRHLEALARGERPPLDELERDWVIDLMQTCNDLRFFTQAHDAPTPPDAYVVEAQAWLDGLHGRFPA